MKKRRKPILMVTIFTLIASVVLLSACSKDVESEYNWNIAGSYSIPYNNLPGVGTGWIQGMSLKLDKISNNTYHMFLSNGDKTYYDGEVDLTDTISDINGVTFDKNGGRTFDTSPVVMVPVDTGHGNSAVLINLEKKSISLKSSALDLEYKFAKE